MKKLHRGEKGLTLIELLIVVAILGILAAIIVPNLLGFLITGKLAAANTEVANVESAALAYFAENDGEWPGSSTDLYNATTPADSYLSGDTVYATYEFDDFGRVDNADEKAPAEGIYWEGTDHLWVKGSGGTY